MPRISYFYGIVIAMYIDDHLPPHFHAIFAEDQAQIDFDGNIIAGGLPSGKQRLVLAWLELHREELEVNWKLLHSSSEPNMIDPLR